MQFKQGDTVISSYTEIPGKVVHGPFIRAAMGHDAYLVELLEGENKGECSVWHTQDMKPAPRFKVGRQAASGSDTAEIMAGPFPDEEGDVFWVVRLFHGGYERWWEMHMQPV